MKPFFNKIVLVIFSSFPVMLIAQDVVQDSLSTKFSSTSKWLFSGYVKDLQSIQFAKLNRNWNLDNLIHNRFDLQVFPANHWQIHLGLRNRLLYGASAPLYAQNESLLGQEKGLFRLSKTLASGESYVLHSAIDRASIDFTSGKWQVGLGRQRINWGMNLVWNPNDVFNAFSWFDFDYEERPGSDALRIQFYPNSTSSVEIAWQPGRKTSESIAGGLYRFNKKGYDIQFLAVQARQDFVLGAGWSGVLGKAGFNGEMSAFIPEKNAGTATTVVSASVGINYTFTNSLFLHGAYLLNSAGLLKGDSLGGLLLIQDVSAKNLMPGKHTIFAEVAYQFTPLLRIDLSGMLNPADGSLFAGPFVTVSLTDNLQLLLAGQLFFGKADTLYGPYGKVLFLRLKWSF